MRNVHSGAYYLLRSLLLSLLLGSGALLAEDLPSWRDGPVKQAIFDFVSRVSTPGSADFIEEPRRVAVFDNDGTLWAEKPAYFQLLFALDRIKAMAPQHPEWKTQQPYAAVLNGDKNALVASGDKGLLQILATTHSGMTTEQFKHTVQDWLANARHPRFQRPYTEMVYEPMLELLSYLRNHGFKTFIVSGGGIEFMRPFTERVYGIEPERVIGSRVQTQFQMRDGKPVLLRLPDVEFVDDGPGKPVGIDHFIGRPPIFAIGNSDGDLQMLQWTVATPGPHFVALVHHTDADREWAYDRKSPVGKLDKALDEAVARNWAVIDMKRDWRKIFPFEEQGRQEKPTKHTQRALAQSPRQPRPVEPAR